jgi:hypothetical protein
MGKINIPGMGRHIRAFGHETHVAEIAAIGNFPISCLLHSIQFARGPLIDEIK